MLLLNMAKWQRPTSVPFPSVWRRFEGKTVHSSGRRLKFRIQDITPELHEDILDHMTTIYIRDEPCCANQNLIEDPQAVQEYTQIIAKILKGNAGLVCLVDNLDELNDPNLPQIAGCNITFVQQKHSKEEIQCQAEASKKLSDLMATFSQGFDFYSHYGVDKYLYAFGLSVGPKFRGQGIGLELLKARFDLGRAIGIHLTVSVFTSVGAQKSAEKAGFVTHLEQNFEDYEVDGKVVYTNLSAMAAKSIKAMAARIE